MNKGIIVGVSVLVAAVAGLIIWLASPASNVFNSVTSSKYKVDPSKVVTLDFKDASIDISEWNNNYVEVTYDSQFKGKKNIEINNADNTLTLVSDVNSGIRIKIPKTEVKIKAGEVQAQNCTIKELKTNKATLRYCSTGKDFTSEGQSIEIRESKMAANAVIKNSVVNLRECDIEDVTLKTDNTDKKIDANLREVRGLSIKFDAKSYNSLSAEIKDPNLEKLIIDSDSDKGSITVISGSINNIENNSKINITKKKNSIN